MNHEREGRLELMWIAGQFPKTMPIKVMRIVQNMTRGKLVGATIAFHILNLPDVTQWRPQVFSASVALSELNSGGRPTNIFVDDNSDSVRVGRELFRRLKRLARAEAGVQAKRMWDLKRRST